MALYLGDMHWVRLVVFLLVQRAGSKLTPYVESSGRATRTFASFAFPPERLSNSRTSPSRSTRSMESRKGELRAFLPPLLRDLRGLTLLALPAESPTSSSAAPIKSQLSSTGSKRSELF